MSPIGISCIFYLFIFEGRSGGDGDDGGWGEDSKKRSIAVLCLLWLSPRFEAAVRNDKRVEW